MPLEYHGPDLAGQFLRATAFRPSQPCSWRQRPVQHPRSPAHYLYRTHETGANGAVSVTDLKTGVTTVLARRPDWERFDGLVWTPWGTLLAAEETNEPLALRLPARNSIAAVLYRWVTVSRCRARNRVTRAA